MSLLGYSRAYKFMHNCVTVILVGKMNLVMLQDKAAIFMKLHTTLLPVTGMRLEFMEHCTQAPRRVAMDMKPEFMDRPEFMGSTTDCSIRVKTFNECSIPTHTLICNSHLQAHHTRHLCTLVFLSINVVQNLH